MGELEIAGRAVRIQVRREPAGVKEMSNTVLVGSALNLSYRELEGSWLRA